MSPCSDDPPSFRLTSVNLLAFAIGACLLWFFPRLPEPIVLAVMAAAIMIVAVGLPIRERNVVLCSLLGLTLAHASADRALAMRLPPALEGVDLIAEGRVEDLPDRDGDGTRFRFCPDSATQAGRSVDLRGCWRLGWYAPRHRGRHDEAVAASVPLIEPGTHWRLTVRLKRPRALINPGGFDSERKALETRISAVGYVRESASNRQLAPPGGIDMIRARIAERIDTALTDRPRMAALLRGLAVGDRRGFEDRDWLALRQTGTTHLFSISGLHVGMIAVFVGLLVSGLTRVVPSLLRIAPRRVWMLPPALLAAFGYALLAGLEVATQRSVAMIAVAGVAVMMRRGAGAWHSWCLALAVIIAIDPLAMLGIGFWLSYLGVAWLILQGQGRHRQAWWRSASRAQWAVTLGLLPIGIGFFAQASWLSPLVNLIAIPWITFVIVPVLLVSLPMLSLVPVLGEALLAASAALLSPLMSGMDVIVAWPLAATVVPEPGVLAVICATLAAGLCCLPVAPRVRWLGLPLSLPLLLSFPAPPASGDVELHVLDVGQGTSILVRTHAHALLFDTGARFPNGYDLGEAVVVPALRALGNSRLDMLVVSHADNDHAGGASTVIREFQPAQVLLGESLRGVDGEPCREHRRWRWDGVEFQLLHPPARYPTQGNDVSCVLKITAAGTGALLTGDAGAVAELRMINLHRPALASDVLILGHHGSLTSSIPEFMDAVSPKLAVATAGYRNRFGHPHPDVLRRLAWRGAEVLQTSLTGSLRITIGAEGVGVEARRDRRRRFWSEP
jgi:competence protein ComEC